MDLDVPVQILGINDIGLESGNDSMAAMADLPWLQATDEVDVWTMWSAGYRDVLILDENNVEIDRFNLTSGDLSEPSNYATLRDIFVTAATLD